MQVNFLTSDLIQAKALYIDVDADVVYRELDAVWHRQVLEKCFEHVDVSTCFKPGYDVYVTKAISTNRLKRESDLQDVPTIFLEEYGKTMSKEDIPELSNFVLVSVSKQNFYDNALEDKPHLASLHCRCWPYSLKDKVRIAAIPVYDESEVVDAIKLKDELKECGVRASIHSTFKMKDSIVHRNKLKMMHCIGTKSLFTIVPAYSSIRDFDVRIHEACAACSYVFVDYRNVAGVFLNKKHRFKRVDDLVRNMNRIRSRNDASLQNVSYEDMMNGDYRRELAVQASASRAFVQRSRRMCIKTIRQAYEMLES